MRHGAPRNRGQRAGKNQRIENTDPLSSPFPPPFIGEMPAPTHPMAGNKPFPKLASLPRAKHTPNQLKCAWCSVNATKGLSKPTTGS